MAGPAGKTRTAFAPSLVLAQKSSMSWDPFGLLNESEIEVRFALSLVRV